MNISQPMPMVAPSLGASKEACAAGVHRGPVPVRVLVPVEVADRVDRVEDPVAATNHAVELVPAGGDHDAILRREARGAVPCQILEPEEIPGRVHGVDRAVRVAGDGPQGAGEW